MKILIRIISYIKRKLFILLYGNKFYFFSSKSSILDPLKIEGFEYMYIDERVSIGKYGWLGCYPVPDKDLPKLRIGKGVNIGNLCHISCTNSIIIEDNVLIAEKVTLADSTHEYERIDIPIIHQPFGMLRSVKIGEGSWIADNCCILGASIGKHCVIGAGSVVTKDIPDFCVAVGNPAKIIKRYNPESEIWEKVNY